MVMEVKITTKMLADRMLANYKETEHLLCASAEIELTRLLGRDFVEEAFTLAKNSIVGGKLFCKNCRHCHPLLRICQLHRWPTDDAIY